MIDRPQQRMTAAQFRAQLADGGVQPEKRKWSNATPTVCECGRTHDSKMEAKVCRRLTLECEARGETLLQQVRMPLWCLAPGDKGSALYISIDFVIVVDNRMARAIDAKGARKSRDWLRGKRAFESSYGMELEETSK